MNPPGISTRPSLPPVPVRLLSRISIAVAAEVCGSLIQSFLGSFGVVSLQRDVSVRSQKERAALCDAALYGPGTFFIRKIYAQAVNAHRQIQGRSGCCPFPIGISHD